MGGFVYLGKVVAFLHVWVYIVLKTDDKPHRKHVSRGTVTPVKVEIGPVLNGVLYLRYGSSSKINAVKRCKTLIDEKL